MAGKKLGRFLDILCVAGVILIPVSLGVFLFALISLEGAPAWYLVLHGLLFALSIVALMDFIANGLLRAVFSKKPPEKQEVDKV